MSLNNNIINNLLKNIKELEFNIEMENMFNTVKDVEDINMLTHDELKAISKGMDKTNYNNNYINNPRWIDLTRLLTEIIKFKKQYPEWILENIEMTGRKETFPPKNFYKFTYKTPHGHHFNIYDYKNN
jgi:hypothetical protein